MTVAETPWYSWCTGPLARGCQMCVKGRKLVLFVTGLCAQRCFYCPVSEQKFGKDAVFANEQRVTDPDSPAELLTEAELTDARGAGITGGDPLVRTERCCAYIRMLKLKYGKRFHIHLYTPLKLVTPERLKQLHDAGLDEIRFHPDLDDRALWSRLELARAFDWVVGVEIPAIPGYGEKTKKLIDFIADKVDFLNLNELELSDTQAAHYRLAALGYRPKDDLSYGAAGSKEMAMDMLVYAQSKGLRAHFCTAKTKDGVQMKERLKLRAKHVALPFDKKTEEGTLLRGCCYLPDLVPSAGYREKLKSTDKNMMLPRLHTLRSEIIANLKIKEDAIVIDENKLRLLLPRATIKQYAPKLKKLGLVPSLVEEYPTADAIEVDVEFL